MHNTATILPLAAEKEAHIQNSAEEKLIDLLSAIIVDTVLNKISYEKEMHHIPALQ